MLQPCCGRRGNGPSPHGGGSGRGSVWRGGSLKMKGGGAHEDPWNYGRELVL